MIDYGIQYSAVEPKEVEAIGPNIFVADNIEPYSQDVEDRHMEGFQYHCVCYTKDEYIAYLAKRNYDLEQQIINTQVALCDLYESLGGD